MKVLVTGGLGFIGSAVARGLLASGHEVVLLDDSSRGARSGGDGLERVPILDRDVRSFSAVREACSGVDAVAHLAAVQGTGTFYREPGRVLEVNVAGTLNVARACAETGVRRLVFASSSEVYGSPPVVPTPEDAPLVVPDVTNPRFSYGGSKIIGELIVVNYARQSGFEYTVLRYHNVYGPRMGWDHVIPQFIARLERREPFTVEGDGTQTRAFCYVDDAADATVGAITRPEAANTIINVGNPEREWSINELVALLAEVSGKKIEPRYVPLSAGGTLRRTPDITRARETLGYEPRVPLREGLARTYRWYSAAVRERDAEGRHDAAAKR